MNTPRQAEIRGAGWVSAAGPGDPRNGAAFRAGPGPLPRVRWRDILDTSNPRFGRLDDFSRAGVLAAAKALQDAGMTEWDGAKRYVGIIAGTHWGCLASDLDYYATAIPQHGALASPNRFAYTLPNCFLGEVAITFGLAGPGYVINSGSSSPGAGGMMETLHVALDWLEGGCEAMLAGFCDVAPARAPGPPAPVGAGFVVLRPAARHPADPLLRLEGEDGWVVGTRARTWAELFAVLHTAPVA